VGNGSCRCPRVTLRGVDEDDLGVLERFDLQHRLVGYGGPVAGPDADATSKPIGLTYIGIASPAGTRCYDYVLDGDRWSNRQAAAAKAIQLLVDETRKLVPVVKA